MSPGEKDRYKTMKFSTQTTAIAASPTYDIYSKSRRQLSGGVRSHVGLVDVTNQLRGHSSRSSDWSGIGNHDQNDGDAGASDSRLFRICSAPNEKTLQERRKVRQQHQRQREHCRKRNQDLEQEQPFEHEDEHEQDRYRGEEESTPCISSRDACMSICTVSKSIPTGIFSVIYKDKFRLIDHVENVTMDPVNCNEDQGIVEVEQLENETGGMHPMPPPSREMTNLILRKRSEGIHDLRFSCVSPLVGEQNDNCNLVARMSDGTPIFSSLSFSRLDNRAQDFSSAVGRGIEENDEGTVGDTKNPDDPELLRLSLSANTCLQRSVEQDAENEQALLFANAGTYNPYSPASRLMCTNVMRENKVDENSDCDDIEDQRYVETCLGNEYEDSDTTADGIGQHGMDTISKPSLTIRLDMRPSISPITTPSDDVIENENENDNNNDSGYNCTDAPKSKQEESSGSTNSIRKQKRGEEESVSDENKVDENGDSNNCNHSIVRFQDIIGHQSVKLRLDEVLLPLALPPNLSDQILKGIRSLPASILLYGPPGCGKTQLARALAGEADAAFLPIGPSDILSKYVGESEAAVRSVFAEAFRMARDNEDGNKCTVLFFDEIDALGQSRGQGSSCGAGFGSTNGNQRDLTMGSGTSGSSGGDNPSRRVLAELLIQLNKVNASYGTFHSRELTNKEHVAAKNNAYCATSGPEEDYNTEQDWSEEEHGYEGENSTDASVKGCQEEGGATPVDAYNRVEYCPQQKRRVEAHDRSSVQVDDDLGVRIIVVAATNRPEDCDPALIRRFAIQVPVGLPTERDRKKILKKNMKEIEHTITKQQFSRLALITDGWSGSDLQSLAREAAMAPVRECIRRAALLKRRKQNLPCSASARGVGKNMREHKRRKTKDLLSGDAEKRNTSRSRDFHSNRENTDGDDSSSSFTDPQNQLLEEFRNLRPVSFQDYTRALTLWFSRMYHNVYDSPLAEYGLLEESEHHDETLSRSGVGFWNEHYDSSSDEEDGDSNENQRGKKVLV